VFAAADYYTAVDRYPDDRGTPGLAGCVLAQTFRTDFNAPGFSLLTFATPITSEQLRRCMIVLRMELHASIHAKTGRCLAFQSVARFDQQVTTKFHLDGGPAESFLMLGYEPSEVPSALAMADYTRAAHQLGIEPKEFLDRHNPMFASGAKLLEGTITQLTAFDWRCSSILFINNSSLPYDAAGRHQLGVMHQATILKPDASKQRIINSTMLSLVSSLEEEKVKPDQQQEYIRTTAISRPSGY
jgi:hypothetical protein